MATALAPAVVHQPPRGVNKEIKGRSNVVGIFPNDDAVIRTRGCRPARSHDEWQVADRRYFSEPAMAQLHGLREDDPTKEVNDDQRHALPAA